MEATKFANIVISYENIFRHNRTVHQVQFYQVLKCISYVDEHLQKQSFFQPGVRIMRPLK